MSILTAPARPATRRLRPTKPVRVAPRPDAPFGEGLEERGLCCPIDQRPLPTINGQGLEQREFWRINGAQNRAMASYGFDCPEASQAEIERVGRLAATDELRRVLAERPAAPALKPVDGIHNVDVIPVPMGTTQTERPRGRCGHHDHASRRPYRPYHERQDEIWWSTIRDAEERGLAQAAHDEDDESEDQQTMNEWLESACPCTFADIDHAHDAFIGEVAL